MDVNVAGCPKHSVNQTRILMQPPIDAWRERRPETNVAKEIASRTICDNHRAPDAVMLGDPLEQLNVCIQGAGILMQSSVPDLVQMIDRVVKYDDIVGSAVVQVFLNGLVHQDSPGGPERRLRLDKRRARSLFASRQKWLQIVCAQSPFEYREVGTESPTSSDV